MTETRNRLTVQTNEICYRHRCIKRKKKKGEDRGEKIITVCPRYILYKNLLDKNIKFEILFEGAINIIQKKKYRRYGRREHKDNNVIYMYTPT